MSVGSGTPYNVHTGNGTTTVFAYGFTLLDEDDLVVTLDGVASTAFTVSGVGDDDGGSVTFTTAPASGVKVALRRVLTLQRLVDYQNNGDLLATVLNSDFDRLLMMIQGASDGNTRAVRAPFPETLDDLPTAANRANKVLSFDAAGNPTAAAPDAGTATALALALLSTASDSDGDALIGVKAVATGAVARTQHARNEDFRTITDFASLQDALNAGGSLYVPAGVHNVTAQLTVSSNTHLWGPGTLKATAAINSILYIQDKSNVTIEGVTFDGSNLVVSAVRAYQNGGTLAHLRIEGCTFSGTKNDATLQYGCVEVARLSGSGQASDVVIRGNLITSCGTHGFIVAYADDVTISDNVLFAVGQHGAEAVHCSRVNMTGNRINGCGTIGPGGSGLGVGSNCSNFTIAGNVLNDCGGDASITVEHNSVQGAVIGNAITGARTAGINVSFGTPGAAPFDVVHSVAINGNTIVGDGVNTVTRRGILVYSSAGALGHSVTVQGNAVSKFNVGLDMSYIEDSEVGGNVFDDHVGASTHGITLTYCKRVNLVGNAGGDCSGNVLQILNQSTNHSDKISVVGLSGTCAGFAMVYIEGDLEHTLVALDTTSAAGWVTTASGSCTVNVMTCRGNLTGTPIMAGVIGTAIGNSPPTNDFARLGSLVVKQGTGSPEGVLTAAVGSLYLRSDGGAGTALYVKQTGAGNTGWASK